MLRKWIFIASLALLQSLSAQWADLTLKLEKRKTYTQNITTKVAVKQVINGQEVQAQAQNTSVVLFKIKKKTGVVYDCQATYQKADLEMYTIIDGKAMPLGKMKDWLNQATEGMLGVPFWVELNQKGKILKTKDMEKIFAKALQQLEKIHKKNPLSELQKKQVQEQLEKSFAENSLKANLGAVMSIFPMKRVKVGEPWQITSTLMEGFPQKISTQYTLVQANKNFLLIEGKAQIQVENQPVTLEQGQRVSFTLRGEIRSKIKLHPKTKWILSAQMQQQIQGESRVENPRREPTIIPMDTSSEMLINNE